MPNSQFALGEHLVSRFSLCLVLTTCALAGCGDGRPKTYPVSGLVTFNDQPVPTGWVLFLSEQDETTTATIGSDGRYQVRLSAGEYRVGISAPREGSKTGFDAFKEAPLPPHVPVSFAQPEHTGIVVTVQEQGENTFDVPLTSGRRRGRG